MKIGLKFFHTLFGMIALSAGALVQGKAPELRKEILLNEGWATVFDNSSDAHSGFEHAGYACAEWKKVAAPHSWEDYQGYRRMRHGNLHGYAWYRKEFAMDKRKDGKRCFLFFEGVGSYATVWVNGQKVGAHAGGRTTFTVDVTDALKYGATNLLAVRADHPAEIRDLPWVCGGCSSEWGFSEGSQPIGIFRPVTLVITGDLRVEPFGVHVWNDEQISEKEATLYTATEVRNYSGKPRRMTIATTLLSPDGNSVARVDTTAAVGAGATVTVSQVIRRVSNPQLWSPEQPSLYKVVTEVYENKKVIDRCITGYGIRKISWPVGRNGDDKRFFINGKPFFINGTCEYEHNMGSSHAFSDAQIDARVAQMRAAGFNAFRDAHQPHNLRYSYHWDRLGMLWWTQLSAHIWFDTPEFRSNFKVLLREWVKERRNSPSLALWGLQNESALPADFAEECAAIIRELDPTASSQRKITTCNGGTGTDWNVIQNWTGTYGGDPYIYDKDMERHLLNGEYGAWRSIDLHTEGGFDQKGPLSEDRMTRLMELKVRLAEQAKDKICGQFHWLFNSHENPGRTQNGEGLRELDRIGPVNYKGLFTAWGEPTDAFYMYRSSYAPKDKEPMLYIAMHTWPDRWTTAGVKDSIVVYSNCDEVALWNDTALVGVQKHSGEKGTHFTFSGAAITSNLLHAYGTVNGDKKPAASDAVLLHHLPKASSIGAMLAKAGAQNITQPQPGYSYLYRVSCGGPDYTDVNGNLWQADVRKATDSTWGARSWTDDYSGLPPFYASQRRTNDLIYGTMDGTLFQTFRYGQGKLRYEFPLPNGDYLVELYFVEPWYGRAGGLNCEGWRIFDVAVNDVTVIKKLDIWKTAGYNHAHKEIVEAHVKNGVLKISFPQVASGQAIISAIAVATKKPNVQPAQRSPLLMYNLAVNNPHYAGQWSVAAWMDTGDKQYSDSTSATCLSALPPKLYGATWLRVPKICGNASDALASFTLANDADVFVGIAEKYGSKPAWMDGYAFSQSYVENAEGEKFALYARRFAKGDKVTLGRNITASTPMYLTAAVYATTLETASDLRPAVRIEAEASKISGSGAKQEKIGENEVVRFTHPLDNAVEFSFAVGVADTYTVRIRYRNPQNDTIPLHIRIEDANGAALRSDTVYLSPTPENKLRTLTTTTGTQINAGAYMLRLSGAGKAGIALDYVEIQ
ncbi:MAG: beta galactosidase jelly roll domain-containing protein [Prevotellaceae bacterium]|jgi:hypothetical protein|nr:beta galactosidase jelly roll domain-containing protein [Prevotellaceae bacterium]